MSLKLKKVLSILDVIVTVLFIVLFYFISLFLDPFIKLATACSFLSKNVKFKRYSKNVWLGIDNYESAKLGGHWEDTLSSRLGKAQEAGSTVLGFIADRIDNLWFVTLKQENHCSKAIELRNNKHQVTGR